MATDPYEVLGIPADAPLEDAESAYRRVVSLFHPDHLQGMRADVRDEGERRLRQATEAIEALRAGSARMTRTPISQAATEGAARTYNAQVLEVGAGRLHADWAGPHAAAVWAALRQAHANDRRVEQVEWGAYECTISGSELLRLLSSVLATEPDWRRHPLESLDFGPRANAGTRPRADVGWLVDHIDDAGQYVVTAEVF